MKPVVMIPKSEVSELAQYSDLELFEFVLKIIIKAGPLTPEQMLELDAINQEFIRRDSLSYLPRG